MIDDAKKVTRVLHLSHTSSPGGAELALLRTLLAGTPWDASLLLPEPSSSADNVFRPLHDEDVPIYRVGPAQESRLERKFKGKSAAGYITGLLKQSVAVRRHEAFKAADVIYSNTSRSALYGALACLGTRKKFIVHLRDRVETSSLGGLGFNAFKWLVLGRADGVIANSKTTLDTAERARPTSTWERTFLISPFGLNRSAKAGKRHEGLGGPLNVGLVARVDPWKGQELLLRAFANVASGTNTRLHIIGGTAFGHDDFMRRLIDLSVELGIDGQVTFTGHVADVASKIDILDICVQCSMRPEPLGQNILQYLSAGKAVIAANEGGPAEWIENGLNGLLFEPRSLESLSIALERVIKDEGLRRQLSKKATDTAGLKTDDEIVRDLDEFIDRVIGIARRKSYSFQAYETITAKLKEIRLVP